MTICHLDVETRSRADLKKVGVYKYALDPSTDVWCASYAFDEGPVRRWRMSEPCPDDLGNHIAAGKEIVAYNANFERVEVKTALVRRHGWPLPKDEQYRCVMAEAMAMALPGSLENAAAALGLDVQKDMAGHRLMLQMCRPRREFTIRRGEEAKYTDRNLYTVLPQPDGQLLVCEWWGDESRRQRLYAYCDQDVITERHAEKRLLRLRPLERTIYLLDQRINDRGVTIDLKLADKAATVVKDTTERLDKEMKQVTKGEVEACSQVQRLVAWLALRGIDTDSVAKDRLADLLITELPDDARRALELRQEAAKASTAKLKAFYARTNGDGRMRGNLMYHGAATGRWSAKGAQLQNLPRQSMKIGEDQVALLMRGDAGAVEMIYDWPLTFVSNCLRPMLMAGKGKDLLSADFANIEGRGVAWFAGETKKLDAFRAYDAKTGPDLYKVAAAGIFGRPVESIGKDGPERQIGKVAELALSYQGGVGAFVAMAKTYQLKIGGYYDIIWNAAREEHREKALQGWGQFGKRSRIEQRTWLAAEVVKVAWRATNPKIAALWPALEEAAISAVEQPGQTFAAGGVKYQKSGSFLWCQLPSGRCLCYPYARIELKKMPWTKADGSPAFKPAIVYKGVDSFTKKWEDQDFYGGLAAENITQAASRDIMAEAMLRVEAKGYQTLFTVHDEIVAEVDEGFGSLEEFERTMTEIPTWARGFPVAAEGWRGKRYRK